jgi:AraC-like DNA-binding protein
MRELLYHQIENTNGSEFSAYVHECDLKAFHTPHFHKNMEIILCITGECTCVEGERRYLLRAGDAIFIFPYRAHSFLLSEGASVRIVTFSELLILTLAKIMEGKSARSPVFRPSSEAMGYFLTEMDRMYGVKSEHNKELPTVERMKTKGLLYTIGGEFLSGAELIPESGSVTLAAEIVQYLTENFRRDVSLHDIADEMGYNYQYLSRTFHKLFGINFREMLNQYRFDYACALLRDTDRSVAEIAFESGFQSLRSFNQFCKETVGRTPKELRSEKA